MPVHSVSSSPASRHHLASNRLATFLLLILGLSAVTSCAITPDEVPSPVTTAQPTATIPVVGEVATEPVGSGFTIPVSIENAGDDRLFVAQRTGEIFVLQPDGTSTMFLDLSERVVTNGAEYGFFDIAFHPDYLDPTATGAGQFFVTYTGLRDDKVYTFLSRFLLSPNPNAADPASETWLLTIEQFQPVHKGGGLDFDRNSGRLYVGIGDDWQPDRAQDPTALNGKILGLNIDGVPADQTGDATASVTPEIIAMGLRNPWRIDVDEAGARILVGDVGDATYEEINIVPLDGQVRNYGWPCMEGPQSYANAPDELFCRDGRVFERPVYAYEHVGPRCAVIGGVVQRLPGQSPNYVFGDMCAREVFLMNDGPAQSVDLLGLVGGGRPIVTFGQGVNGDIYIGRGEDSGPIYRLTLP